MSSNESRKRVVLAKVFLIVIFSMICIVIVSICQFPLEDRNSPISSIINYQYSEAAIFNRYTYHTPVIVLHSEEEQAVFVYDYKNDPDVISAKRKGDQSNAVSIWNNKMMALESLEPGLKAIHKFFSVRTPYDLGITSNTYDKLLRIAKGTDLQNADQYMLYNVISTIDILSKMGIYAKYDPYLDHLPEPTNNGGLTPDNIKKLRDYFESLHHEWFGFLFDLAFRNYFEIYKYKKILSRCETKISGNKDEKSIEIGDISQADKNILIKYFGTDEKKPDDSVKKKALKILKNLPFNEYTRKMIETGNIPMNVDFRFSRIPIYCPPNQSKSGQGTNLNQSREKNINGNKDQPNTHESTSRPVYFNALCNKIRSNVESLGSSPHFYPETIQSFAKIHPKDILRDQTANQNAVFLNFLGIKTDFEEVMKAKTGDISKEDAYLLNGLYFRDDSTVIEDLFEEFSKLGIVFPSELTDSVSFEVALVPVPLFGHDNYQVNPYTMRKYIIKNMLPTDPFRTNAISQKDLCCKPDEVRFETVKKSLERFGPYYKKFFENLLEARSGIYINRIEVL